MATITDSGDRAGNGWLSATVVAALLPPLLPMLVFMLATSVSGLGNAGGSDYVPVLSEAWALVLGAMWWGLPNVVIAPLAVWLRRYRPSVVTGLAFALLIATVASALVAHLGWLGEPYALNWRLALLVGAPLLVTTLLAFITAMVVVPARGGIGRWLYGGRAFFGHAAVAGYLLWLAVGAGLVWWYLAALHDDARHYYWSYEIERAELRDGVPVLQNPLLRWVDVAPTAASTENRAWKIAAAAQSYRIEVRWWRLVAWLVLPLGLLLISARR